MGYCILRFPSQDPGDLMMSAMNAAIPRPINIPIAMSGVLGPPIHSRRLDTITFGHSIFGQLYSNLSSSADNYLTPKDRVPL